MFLSVHWRWLRSIVSSKGDVLVFVQKVKNVIKDMCPELLLNTKRSCFLIKKLSSQMEMPIYKTFLLSEKEKQELKEIKKKYSSCMVVELPTGNIGGMGLMYSWVCQHRKKEEICLFYRLRVDGTRENPNLELDSMIAKDLLDIEARSVFCFRIMLEFISCIRFVNFGDSIRHGIDISRMFFYGKYKYCSNNIGENGYLNFSSEQELAGRKLLNQLGVTKQNYICIFNRDSSYYEKHYTKDYMKKIDLAQYLNTNVRDSSFCNFSMLSEAMNEKGIKCVRMGAIVKDKSSISNVVDYPNIARSEFADIYLFANCKYFLGDPSGILVFPLLARKPMAYINCITCFNHGDSETVGNLVLYKKLYDKRNRRYLTLRFILDLYKEMYVKYYEENLQLKIWEWYINNDIEAMQNSAEEVLELSKEMDAILDGTISYTAKELELKARYKAIMAEYVDKGDFLAIVADIGAKWIVENEWFLE